MAQRVGALGHLLRAHRAGRGMSQLDLALRAGVSARHLSFVETGRSAPSREMVMGLAETLGLPLRDRNALLEAAGYAAVYSETPIDDDSCPGCGTLCRRSCGPASPTRPWW